MRRFVRYIIVLIPLTVLIMASYNGMDKLLFNGITEGEHGPLSVIRNFFSELSQDNSFNRNETFEYKAVWMSYIEFSEYREMLEDQGLENDEEHFREFFETVVDRIKEDGFRTIIVHARPAGDALYESAYFPWAACISGEQGRSPGYDPLKIMVEIAHKKNVSLEAWVNPYRVLMSQDLSLLSEDNQAAYWLKHKSTRRNVLQYDGWTYYNPSSKEVRKLIVEGVREIVRKYDVDGIHLDDYFYPLFTEENVNTDFDAREYKAARKEGSIDPGVTLAQWRRDNVNLLVKALYKAVKEEDPSVTFGISPNGNLDSLTSDYQYYVDIKTWLESDEYVDYIMPQIFWGFTNDAAPFAELVDQWVDLIGDSPVKLYAGLQLYRIGTRDGSPDEEEMMTEGLLKKQIDYLKQSKAWGGCCIFSYQYLDYEGRACTNFDTVRAGKKQKKLFEQAIREIKQSF